MSVASDMEMKDSKNPQPEIDEVEAAIGRESDIRSAVKNIATKEICEHGADGR